MDLFHDNGSASPPDDDMLMSAIMENNLLGLPEGGVELEWEDKVDDTTPSSWEVPRQDVTTSQGSTSSEVKWEGDKVVDVTTSTTQGSTPYEMKWEGDKEKVLRQQVKLFIFQ